MSTEMDHLIARLKAREPYKHPLETMLEDLGEGCTGTTTIFLGQGDYPTVRQIVEHAVRDMAKAAAAIRKLTAERDAARQALAEALARPAPDQSEEG